MGAGVKRRFQTRPGRIWGAALKEGQTREWAARKRGGGHSAPASTSTYNSAHAEAWNRDAPAAGVVLVSKPLLC